MKVKNMDNLVGERSEIKVTNDHYCTRNYLLYYA